LLYPQGVFSGQGGQITHGHERAGVAQVKLESLGVASLPESFDGVRVPQEMGIHLLSDTGLLCRLLNDLPGPLAVDPEKPVIDTQLLIKSEALEPVGQDIGAGHHPGLTALAFDIEYSVATVDAYLSRGETQGFRDSQSRDIDAMTLDLDANG